MKQLDELGEVGVQTVDGDKLQLPANSFETLENRSVRIWFEFPGGKSIYEEFDEPVPWDIHSNKLARIIDYYHIEPANFTSLFAADGPKLIFKEHETTIENHALNDLQDSAPDTLQFADQVSTENSETKSSQNISTWKTVDPIELVDDERYTKDVNTDKQEEYVIGWFTDPVLTEIPQITMIALFLVVMYLLIF